jgi:hypothetical protein
MVFFRKMYGQLLWFIIFMEFTHRVDFVIKFPILFGLDLRIITILHFQDTVSAA